MYLIVSGTQRKDIVLAVAGDEEEALAVLAFWVKRGNPGALIVRTID